MQKNFANGKATLVKVMTLCRQANIEPDLCRHMTSQGHNEFKGHFREEKHSDIVRMLTEYCSMMYC